jgi:predicted RNase H-like HicB family nuclease
MPLPPARRSGSSYDKYMSKQTLHNEFTAIIERDGKWYIGYCAEIPGANGQGETVEECKKNLADAIALILQDRREDAQRGLPADGLHAQA